MVILVTMRCVMEIFITKWVVSDNPQIQKGVTKTLVTKLWVLEILIMNQLVSSNPRTSMGSYRNPHNKMTGFGNPQNNNGYLKNLWLKWGLQNPFNNNMHSGDPQNKRDEIR